MSRTCRQVVEGCQAQGAFCPWHTHSYAQYDCRYSPKENWSSKSRYEQAWLLAFQVPAQVQERAMAVDWESLCAQHGWLCPARRGALAALAVRDTYPFAARSMPPGHGSHRRTACCQGSWS